MRHGFLLTFSLICLSGCSVPASRADTPSAEPSPRVPIVRETQPTFRQFALDAAVLRNESVPAKSLLVLAAGEAGVELHELTGKRVLRFEEVEAGFVEVTSSERLPANLRSLLIASDQRLGALRIYRLDIEKLALHEVGQEPIAINDEITGLCIYASPLTNKLYAFVATDSGLLEQWELFEVESKIGAQRIRDIPAGKGAGHCAVDELTQQVYFSEESVGVWSVAAEPESDSARQPLDLVFPHGGLHEEVKGVAVYRPSASSGFLIARDAGAAAFNVYALDSDTKRTIRIGGDIEIGDAEGLTLFASSLGEEFPQGVLIIADEDAGNYKLVSLDALSTALSIDQPPSSMAAPEGRVHTVQPLVETEPVPSYGDAADDPAIFADPDDPARSVVIGTDKKLGLNVYDLEGKLLQSVPDGRMNNVDLRQGFSLGGEPIALVTATNRTTKSISAYRYDPASQRLSAVSDGVLATGFEDPYGLCMYRSKRTGSYYVFANDSGDGKIRQWKLIDRRGKVAMELVREIEVGSQAEGCAADDELGSLYVAEEDVGLWKYSAEPDGGTARTSIDDVERGNLTDDVEGVAIYYDKNGTGFIVVSNQGEDNYAVYRREGKNEFVGKFHVIANSARGVDGASETDGLDVVSAPLGSEFPQGLLVVQDGRNLAPKARQNFKYVSWADVIEALQLTRGE